MANIHRINDYSNNNNQNFQGYGGQNNQNADYESDPAYVNIPFLSIFLEFSPNPLPFVFKTCSPIN